MKMEEEKKEKNKGEREINILKEFNSILVSVLQYEIIYVIIYI